MGKNNRIPLNRVPATVGKSREEPTPGCPTSVPTVAVRVTGFVGYLCGIAALILLYHQFYPTIYIKTPQEVVKMRIAGKLASEVLEYIEPHVKSGVSTGELNDLCHRYITVQQKAVPAPLNYLGFPKSVCTSLNEVVCHGIPSYDEVLQDGDVLNIDVTVIKDGYHGDTSRMYTVGKIDEDSVQLLKDTREAMFAAIKTVRPGITTGDLGAIIQNRATTLGYGNVRDFTGHGTGVSFHEGPRVAHSGAKGWGARLEPGMIFTIEPMFNQGTARIKIMDDGWRAVTLDGRRSAQWEHTILVTQEGYEILTLRKEEEEAEGVKRTGVGADQPLS